MSGLDRTRQSRYTVASHMGRWNWRFASEIVITSAARNLLLFVPGTTDEETADPSRPEGRS